MCSTVLENNQNHMPCYLKKINVIGSMIVRRPANELIFYSYQVVKKELSHICQSKHQIHLEYHHVTKIFDGLHYMSMLLSYVHMGRLV